MEPLNRRQERVRARGVDHDIWVQILHLANGGFRILEDKEVLHLLRTMDQVVREICQPLLVRDFGNLSCQAAQIRLPFNQEGRAAYLRGRAGSL